MDRGGLSNSGEMTTIRLERLEYSTDEDICGTVELSNTQRKEITSVTLEFSTWRHISTTKSKKSSVEQLCRQSLELFPNVGAENRRYGHDDRVLKTNVMFAFTFSGTKRHATVDFLENARIKNYITCYVHRKSGLLSRDRLVEKNQFQVPIVPTKLEVDALFPDRLFDCLISRPLSTNSSYYDFRARCNTHLMPGLPFLVEVDTAVEAEISSISLSLHQAVYTSVGTEEDDHGLISRYVHEVERPSWSMEGHFRERDSPRRLTHGRRSWLVEWNCPTIQSRTKLPFEPTFYCKTAQGNMERGLSLKVEVELRNAPAKLVAMMHGIQYCPNWKDSRPDQTVSLRQERSVMRSASPPASIRSAGQAEYPSHRRASVISDRSGTSFNFSQQQQQFLAQQQFRGTPIASPSLSVRSGDYFEDALSRGRAPTARIDAKLTHGSNSPQAIHLFSRSDSVRSANGPLAPRPSAASLSYSRHSGSLKARPDKLTLPPASIRSSMSSAFENMNLRNVSPSSSNLNSPTRRGFEEIGTKLHPMPTPPPTQPLPPAPSNNNAAPSTMHASPGVSPSGSAMSLNEENLKIRQKKPTKLSRPAVILGVSQDTIQTREDADRARAQEQSTTEDFGAVRGVNNAYSASIKRAGDVAETYAATDRDSGFSETSFMPGSPLVGRTQALGAPIQSTGFARRAGQRVPGEHDNQDDGTVMLG